jgi:hypothetical protein
MLLEKLRNFAQISGIKEPIHVERQPLHAEPGATR